MCAAARVMLYVYNASPAIGAQGKGVDTDAKTMLEALHNKRKVSSPFLIHDVFLLALARHELVCLSERLTSSSREKRLKGLSCSFLTALVAS